MLQSYWSTGYFVHDCSNGLQPPITGSGIFESFLSQCDANGKAYFLARTNALTLRESNPCLTDPTGSLPSGSGTGTTPPSTGFIAYSGTIFYDWTGDFDGESSAYYDIVAWGDTQGYLSGNAFGSNQYFSSLAVNDLNGYGTVIGVLKGSGSLTGFGSNLLGLLNFPANLTGVLEVSIGYDHCVALLNNNTVTGWGLDNYGALNMNATLPRNVRRAFAGIGSSVFLLASGIITGTQTIGGGLAVTYPPSGQSGFLDIDYYLGHILAIKSDSTLTGFGQNLYGESNYKSLSQVSDISAGISKNVIIYNDGDITGYGSNISTIPSSIGQSGKRSTFKSQIGTILYKNQDISQWLYPSTASFQSAPSYLDNNVVAIDQGIKCTAAIFKRQCQVTSPTITGYNYLWKVTDLGGPETYGGISVNDLYPPSSTVTQACNCYSFVLPAISYIGESWLESSVPGCSDYTNTHDISFVAVRSQPPILNINYTITGFAPKTGFAATGITVNDYWNPVQSGDLLPKPLFYSDGTASTISGGFFETTFGRGISWSHPDNMFATAVSGSGAYSMLTKFYNFESGAYSGYFYGHGPATGEYTKFTVSMDGDTLINDYTWNGSGFNSDAFSEGNQYLSTYFFIEDSGDYVFVICSGFINGIQFVKL